MLKRTGVKTLQEKPETILQDQCAGFWARLLGDESVRSLSHLEQLLTGCEIIAALDDLDLLEDRSR